MRISFFSEIKDFEEKLEYCWKNIKAMIQIIHKNTCIQLFFFFVFNLLFSKDIIFFCKNRKIIENIVSKNQNLQP